MTFGIGTSKRGAGGARRWGRRLLVPTVALALLAPIGQLPTATAGEQGLGRPDVPKPRISKVQEVNGLGAKKARQKVSETKKAGERRARKAKQEQTAAWPGPDRATTTLSANRAAEVDLAGVPVAAQPVKTRSNAAAAGAVDFRVLGQKAARRTGITGVLLTAGADIAGTAEVSVDYSTFGSMIGGGWSERLRLVQLPACALTTPHKAACRKQTPLASTNDSAQQTVSAQVRLAQTTSGTTTQLASASAPTNATVFAVTAMAAGAGESPHGTGDYSATGLAASSSWAAGGSSGSFTWNYGLTVPPAAAGPAPSLSLSYDSGSVDGRTASTNNQGTPVGEGFTLTESYIERTYGSCDDDGHDKVFDRCWKYDNALLVLNGQSSRIIKDNTTGTHRLENDDASTVKRSSGADNGDDNGEYWTVITGDGTKYVFGLNKLEGSADQRTNSTWTTPVFGDDSGEPGYDKGSTFADRSLTQAWRWNLDYVEDPRGNASTYWYAKESNHYPKNKAATANASYTRGGYLKEIKYGLRKGALFTDDADAKVTFSHAERCTVTDCSELTENTAKHWPDVPFDSICTSGDTDCNAAGPTFFSRKRLTGIHTYSWSATAGTYAPVDSWTLTQEYQDAGDIGDTTDHVLVLKSIKRTGKAGTAIDVDPVVFTYQLRPNRVDGTDDILPLKRHRIATITSETGAITTVTLSAPECRRSEVLGAAQDSNTRPCYPQFWNINGATEASVDWFHKYRVLAVGVADPTGQNETVENAYDYSGAAWHYADDPFTPKEERTWSQWRGYRDVTVYAGALDTTRSKTVSRYLQGMHGDRKKDGTTRTVSVEPLMDTDVTFPAVTDSDQYAGQLLQKVAYNGSRTVSASYTNYTSRSTATQTVPGAAAHVARWTRPNTSYASTYLTASKSWRTHVVTNRYDDLGMVREVDDYGQKGLGGDETCTRTWYARNADAGINSLVSRTRTVGRECSVADTELDLPADDKRRGDVLADSAVGYDGASTWSDSMKPAKGLVTWTGRAKGYASGSPSWQTMTSSTPTDFDPLGRPTKVTDTDGRAITTAYTPAAAGPLTKTITTNPLGHKATSFLDPRRGQALRLYDANLKKTELAYDSLGRLTSVWLPNRSSASQSPSSKFAYHMDNEKQSWVSSSTLRRDGETYITNYALFDALLRPLQTQSPTPHGGRLLTDIRYDTRGLPYESYADIFDTTSTPNGTYTRAEYGEAPKQTGTFFDGAGRATRSTLHVFGVEKWSTTTSYTGDSTATTALDGGSATRTITDIRGRTLETREYAGVTPADLQYGDGPGTGYASTRFDYTRDGLQTRITGPDDATWSYGYDLFGRQITATDPDRGRSTTEYDALDRAVKSTDSRGKAILTAYDVLGRSTGTWAGSRSDANQLTATSYDALLKGLPDSRTRYVGGKNGKAYTDTVTEYDSLSRPVVSTLQLPANDPFVKAGASAKLEFETAYNLDGTLKHTKEPALGGLPSEIVDYDYNKLGQVTSVGGSTGYLLDADYSAIGRPTQLTLGTANTAGHKKSYLNNRYEDGTDRLIRSFVTDDTHGYMLQDLNYGYDQAGNVTSIADPTTLGGTSSAETQCFAYDGHRRLIEAWTPSSQKCSDPRSAGSLSGPAPYWNSYTYNDAGQRTTETTHSTSGDTRTTYCYTKTDQPHFLTGTTTMGDCAGPEKTYTSDATGNTVKRPGAAAVQDLTWSEEGRLAKLTEKDEATEYLYDASGELLIRSTAGGERVLYAGATELHLRADGTTWAQRYYTAGGRTIAVRSNENLSNKLAYLAGDHHGTMSLAINADATQTHSKRYTSPFGAERGKPTGTPWPDDKGFLGKTDDRTTGLTHIGAREYDPAIGQFISVDPLLSLDQPQSLNGYSYANQHPSTASDPTGLREGCGATYVTSTCASPVKPGVSSAVSGGNPGSPGNSGSKKPYGGAIGGYHDVGYGPSEVRHSSPYIPPPPSYFEVLAAPGPEPDQFEKAFATALAHLQSDRMYNYLPTNELMALAGAATCEQYIDCSKELYSYFVFDLRYSSEYIDSLGPMVGSIGGTPYSLRGKGNPPASGPWKEVRDAACKRCFLAGTDVLMADGTTKDIEDVELGDEVLAANPLTGELGPREVTRLIRTEDDKQFNTLSITTDDGVEELTATHEHPFWSPSQQSWIAAGDLTSGMTLLTEDGHTVLVTANQPFTQHARTYNLTVDDLHTYYVLAGATPVLVHNSNGLCGTAALENGDWQHIVDRHRPGGALVDDAAGIFTGKAKHVRQRIADTINRGTPRPNTPDPVTGAARPGQIYEWDFGVPVGRAGPANGGGELTGVRVIVNDGKVVTAFPY
ncbi:polymorphic toxin-type HINT domain-containing protein [Streptomyces sp. bgisy022]|uniref:polymorphic toxin-type HINT domain-containing protein n=1 Tax=Streptomyces sp. bgisy022 TaxID=3413769 RepID=UPI003D71C7F5